MNSILFKIHPSEYIGGIQGLFSHFQGSSCKDYRVKGYSLVNSSLISVLIRLISTRSDEEFAVGGESGSANKGHQGVIME